MGLFDVAESGTSWMRSRFTKSISKAIRYDCRFHEAIPVLKFFCLPGDVIKIGGNVLVRFQPMLSPTLTANTFKVRYFFVPLRLIEENTELIITGSKNGKLYDTTQYGDLPTFHNFVEDANKTDYPNAYKVTKWSFWDYMRVQPMDYEAIKTDECLPAQYWYKAYFRIKFDFYRDENYDSEDDFDVEWETEKKKGVDVKPFFTKLKKDYFTSVLPWQLKAVAPPTLSFNVLPGSLGLDFTSAVGNGTGDGYVVGFDTTAKIIGNIKRSAAAESGDGDLTFNQSNNRIEYTYNFPGGGTATRKVDIGTDSSLVDALNKGKVVGSTITSGFDSADMRLMNAKTRIDERMARCGSRYVEYLRANFGTAPRDETLQRAQYLGGWSIPIVTSEVLQTAEGTNPVGTMRGHGITRGGNRIQTFHCKEFGLLFGLAEVRPAIEYTTGIPRQLTYKRRWDFINPSFQHLSEQEVRKGELYIDNTDGKNDETLGFQAYGNELRTAQDETVGDLRDSLKYWTQALEFASRPNVSGLINSENHLGSFNKPFIGSGDNRRPIIVQFQNILDAYRPLVRYATPGLIDHL